MTLTSVPLGNLSSSTASPSRSASFICPDHSFVTRLDFQIVYHVLRLNPHNPEGPYVAGISIYCSGIPTSFPVNMQRSPEWPDSIIMPVYGQGWLNGISDLVVYYDAEAVNRIAYGSITAGRAKGTRWTQVQSQVEGCRLKGIKLRHREWAQAAKLYFDCPSPSSSIESPPVALVSSTAAAEPPTAPPRHPATSTPALDIIPTVAVNPIRVARQSLNDQQLATGLYLVLALLSILLVSLSAVLIRWRIRTPEPIAKRPKTHGPRRRLHQQQHQLGYELVDPAQFVIVPVERRQLCPEPVQDGRDAEDLLYLPTSTHLHA